MEICQRLISIVSLFDDSHSVQETGIRTRLISRRFYCESRAHLETWSRTRPRPGKPRARSRSPEPPRWWLPWSVHCFLPDLPDSGTIPAMTHRAESAVWDSSNSRSRVCDEFCFLDLDARPRLVSYAESRRDHETPMITTHTRRATPSSAPVE